MSFGFPQLDSMLKKRGGINQAVQQQQPGQFQSMPSQPEPPKVEAPGMMGQTEQPISGGFAPQMPRQIANQMQPPQAQQTDARPLGQFSGTMKQRMFNQGQQQMNGGLPGGKFNRRRY